MKLNKKHIKNLSTSKRSIPVEKTHHIGGGTIATDHCWSHPNIFCHAPDPTSKGWKCGPNN
ncbi:hypothetical protein CWB96_20755 [Pseudoalteromonas citrea]|mgnify:CR=1 FL=1|uniref:Uncharacterized protein n=1 Tax=Pseudoalteromonas citrea TaxID=43655 RepID=A0A5S3XKM3_9GAMM|nr:hypothetical protein BGP78_16375 [Pseudoalteromonas sp. MSK9-3]TMP45430.1 hypothetical protein CWB97_03915 [Pseudoalteromonas citrea]TMP53673.1 hypothetical protein CWB96_20755 [Pseudoalteromonas citrea]